MAHDLIREAHGLYVRFYGKVTVEEIAAMAASQQGRPYFHDLRYMINDFRGTEPIALDVGGMQTLAAIDGMAETTNKRIRLAFLPERADVVALISAYNQGRPGHWPIAVFPDLDSARDWATLPLRR